MTTLTSALSSALAGLRATQSGLDLVANNVANATTAGYTRKTLTTATTVADGQSYGVKVQAIQRQIDVYLQRQLRTETSGGAYASTKADYLERLQAMFGTPGGDLSLDTAAQDFQSALDALAASPDDGSARSAVLAQAQAFANTLNVASRNVQSLRSDADGAMADGVDAANAALKSIEQLSRQIVQAQAQGGDSAGLLDQRDQAIDALSQLMDIRVEDRAGGDIAIKTGSGETLYDVTASTLSFEPAGAVSAETTYPGAGLSGITLSRGSGRRVDLLAAGALRSGSLHALAEIRDSSGPQAQTQLDELAAGLAQALGTNSTSGSAIAGGVSLTTQGAQPGDRLTVNYTSGGTARSVTIVNVGDASRLPLADSLTADPSDVVIGVDLSSPTAAADINAALASRGVAIDATATSGGFALTANAASLTVTGGQSQITATALSGGGMALPVFVDGDSGQVYSGSLDGGSQLTGFAGRIAVNSALLQDPAKLTAYADGVATGDDTRAVFLRDAFSADRTFSAATGLGGASSPFKGSVADFASGAINFQASASAAASRVSDGQALVVSSLADRLSSESGVDVDEEMSNLIKLQTAYSANARIISAVKEMMDALLRI